MSTRSDIMNIANQLVLSRGYNAFSFADISGSLGIKKASIHYHFPTKTALGRALIRQHEQSAIELFEHNKHSPPVERLVAFFSNYESRKVDDQVCLVGSLATDLRTVEVEIQEDMKSLAAVILNGLSDILEDGKKIGAFTFNEDSRTKALMIITNLLGALQVSRLTGDHDFYQIKNTILENITT
ncbi:MAG: TetR/AcrR family transcriptional regulator [Marinoscillum sp.]